MSELNKEVLTSKEEENLAEVAEVKKQDSPLLREVRQKFGVFGGLSLLFGIVYTFCFYKADLGLNCFIFTAAMVGILIIVMRQLLVPIKRATKAYYTGTILLGLSSVLTASYAMQFFNTIGILLLLEVSLLHQFYDDLSWNVLEYIGKMLSLLFSSIGAIGKPFVDLFRYMKDTKYIKNETFRNVLIGVVISVPMLFVIVALLSSADLLFRNMTRSIYDFLFSSNIFFIAMMVLFGFVICYSILCASLSKAGIEPKETMKTKAAPAIAVTFMGILCVIYIIFCGIQMAYLFRNELFTLPSNVTYSEYARSGFFELLAVTIINIILILISDTFFAESRILRWILTIITGCTYAIMASATYRMILYIGVYRLTFLRLLVLLFLLMDAFVLAGVIVFVYRKNFPLFGYSVAVITVCYLIFSFAKPDYHIAAYLINHHPNLQEDDIAYLTYELSQDAAPVVLPFISKQRGMIDENNNSIYHHLDVELNMKDYYSEIEDQNNKRGIRDFNLSHTLAARYAKMYPMKH